MISKAIRLRIVNLLLLSFFLTNCEDFEKQQPFHLKFELELGADRGQALGTLFQIENSGEILCAAGFQNSYETYVGNNNRILSFFITSDAEFELERIGNPFPEKHRKTRLFALNNRLIAKTIEADGPFKHYNKEAETWEIEEGMTENISKNFKYLQLVDNKLLSFHHWNILYDGDTIYSTPAYSSFLNSRYCDGRFLLFNHAVNGEKNSISLGSWLQGDDSIRITKTYEDPCINQSSNYPYCILNYKSGFLIGTNYGMLFYVDEAGLEVVYGRQPEDPSWQPYCMMSYFDKVLIGQYPSGSMFSYDGHLEPFEPAISSPFGSTDDIREAQSTTIYGGSILTGTWPWGNVHYFNQADSNWDLAFRLFELPSNEEIIADTTPVEAPFIDLFEERDSVYNNTWGQRVTGFVHLDESIYASTSNKGWITPEEDLAFLGEDVVAQYGTVHKITKPGQVASEIQWKQTTILEFVYENDSIQIIQDDNVLISRAFASLSEFPVAYYLDNIVLGEGIYGKNDKLKIKQL